MNKFNFDEFMDYGCPICGAEAEDDCLEDCQGMPVPPQMFGFVEEQMAYVTHRVSRKLMKEFKMKLFTEKLENILQDLPEYKSFARAMVNSNTLQTADSVLDFFTEPNKYRRHYVIWNELGKPIDETRETWTMFMEAIRNTNGQQT